MKVNFTAIIVFFFSTVMTFSTSRDNIAPICSYSSSAGCPFSTFLCKNRDSDDFHFLIYFFDFF